MPEKFPTGPAQPEENQIGEKTPEITAELVKPVEITYSKFESDFNIKKEELDQVDNFKDLTEGQKELVLENLEQFTLSEVQKEAIEQYQKEREEAGFWGKTSMGVFKKFYMAGDEKETANRWSEGGIEKHRDIISEISKNIKETGLDGHLEKGKFKVDYAGNPLEILKGGKNIQEKAEQAAQIRSFNAIADKMVNAENEWEKGKKDKGFEKIKKEYEAARANLLSIKKVELGDDGKAALAVAEIDRRVYMNQWLNANPKAEKELEKMKSQWAWARVFRNTAFEKGGYTAMGYIGRTYAVGVLGFVAAPLTAAAIGGWVGRGRAIESIKEEMKVTAGGGEHKLSQKGKIELYDDKKKRGVEEKRKVDLLNVVDAGTLSNNIEKLSERLNEAKSEKEKGELAQLMNTRLSYTRTKIDMGLVNFGAGKEKLQKQYDLIEKLTQAEVKYAATDSKVKTAVDKRLEQFLGYKSGRIDKYVRNQMLKGAGIGIGCALIGTAIREFFHGNQPVHRNLMEDLRGAKDNFGKLFEHDVPKANLPYAPLEKSNEILKSVGIENNPKDTTVASIAAESQNLNAPKDTTLARVAIESKTLNVSKDTAAAIQTGIESKVSANAGKSAAKAVEKIQEHVVNIKKGSSLWSAARELVKQKIITEKQFNQMWSSEHSKFFTSSNVDTHISKMDLVHQGDSIKAIMGGKGIPPHFELTEKTPGTAGTDQDLYDYYLSKTSKTPPEWLRKQVWGEDYASHGAGAANHAANVAHPGAPHSDYVADKIMPDYLKSKPHMGADVKPPRATGDMIQRSSFNGQVPDLKDLARGAGIEHSIQDQYQIHPNVGPESNDLPPDFLNRKPEIPEIGAVGKQNAPLEIPNVKRPAVENLAEFDNKLHEITKAKIGEKVSEVMKNHPVVEQLTPKSIEVKGENMNGSIEFSYDKAGNPIGANSKVFLRNSTGEEFLKKNWFDTIKEKASETQANSISLRTGLELNDRNLNIYLKTYEQISKNSAYEKQSSFLAKVIKGMLKNMTNKYGDVFDPDQLPEDFRPVE